jgi:hypothetical protein
MGDRAKSPDAIASICPQRLHASLTLVVANTGVGACCAHPAVIGARSKQPSISDFLYDNIVLFCFKSGLLVIPAIVKLLSPTKPNYHSDP